MKAQIRKYSQAARAGADKHKLGDDRRETLILEFAPVVKYIADRMTMHLPSGISREDLISAGVLGLNDAMDKFKAEKGVKFKTYATYRIKGAMVDELRKMGWASRSVIRDNQQIERSRDALKLKLGREPKDIEVADQLGVDLDAYHQMLWRTRRIALVSLDEMMPDGNTPRMAFQTSEGESPFDALKVKELKQAIAREIENLSRNEQMVISLYYYEELTLKEIGKVLDLTESRISQIHSKVISKLRTRLQSSRDEV